MAIEDWILTTSLRTSRFASHPGPILLVIHVLHIYTCIYLNNTQELNTILYLKNKTSHDEIKVKHQDKGQPIMRSLP